MSIELHQPGSTVDELRVLSQLATHGVLAIATCRSGQPDQELLRDAMQLLTILRQAKPLQVRGLKRLEARLVERASVALAGETAKADLLEEVEEALAPTQDLINRLLEGAELTSADFPAAEKAQSLFNSLSLRFTRLALSAHRARKAERSLSGHA